VNAFLCPCGERHVVSWKTANIIRNHGRNVIVTTSSGSWWVPRIWIAVHGVAAIELPTLARDHHWAAA
jgi:hypothetical protein